MPALSSGRLRKACSKPGGRRAGAPHELARLIIAARRAELGIARPRSAGARLFRNGANNPLQPVLLLQAGGVIRRDSAAGHGSR